MSLTGKKLDMKPTELTLQELFVHLKKLVREGYLGPEEQRLLNEIEKRINALPRP